MTNRFRAIAAGTMLTVGSGSVGCGYLLHPERRGLQSGVIDGATMVMDCLWLLAGIVPGVVALVVDFSSGGIYATGRRAELRLTPEGHLALKVPRASRPGRVEFRLVTASHQILARRTVMVGAPGADDSVELQLARPAGEPVYLEVENAVGRLARMPNALETARL
jgi:hypothetical protein